MMKWILIGVPAVLVISSIFKKKKVSGEEIPSPKINGEIEKKDGIITTIETATEAGKILTQEAAWEEVKKLTGIAAEWGGYAWQHNFIYVLPLLKQYPPVKTPIFECSDPKAAGKFHVWWKSIKTDRKKTFNIGNAIVADIYVA